MLNITLKYLEGAGRGEPIRLTLTIGGRSFKDERFTHEQLNDLKKTGKLPFDEVPVLIVDGETISQSGAILRYCGKLTGLYPKDDLLKAARVDEFLCAMEDLVTSMMKTYNDDPGFAKKARDELIEKETPRFVEGVNRICGKSMNTKFLCGNDISIADVYLYVIVSMVKNGKLKDIPKDLFDASPKILKSYKATNEHPKVVEWNKAHPDKTST